MGSFCSKTTKTGRSITRVIDKTSGTPKLPQPQSKRLDTNSTSLSAPTKKNPASLSNRPRRGVIGEIAKNATGVAIGSAVGRKLSNMFDDKKGDEPTVESPIETDNTKYNINGKNEELIENDDDGQGDDSGGNGDEENDDDSN